MMYLPSGSLISSRSVKGVVRWNTTRTPFCLVEAEAVNIWGQEVPTDLGVNWKKTTKATSTSCNQSQQGLNHQIMSDHYRTRYRSVSGAHKCTLTMVCWQRESAQQRGSFAAPQSTVTYERKNKRPKSSQRRESNKEGIGEGSCLVTCMESRNGQVLG